MSQENLSGTKSFETNEAIAQYLRMKIVTGKWSIAGAGERSMASNVGGYAASGARATGRLRNHPGTRMMVAASAIAAGAIVYGAASGKVNDIAIGPPEGIAMEAATGDGSVFEVYYGDLPGTLDVGTLAAAGSAQGDAALLVNSFTSVSGADGTVGVILQDEPTGTQRWVYNSVATNGLKIYPATGDTINGGSANAAITIEGKTLALLVKVDGTNWAVIFTANT